MMKLKTFFLIILAVSLSKAALAYDVVGHRIVADVAYQNLTKKARKQVDKVLGTKGIIYTSSWADEIKSDKSYDYSYVWHYQNLKPGMNDADIQHLLDNPGEDGEHLFLAVQNMVKRLQKDKNDQEALKFLVHLVGDLHQPLHLGRPEDLGGNKVMFQWFGRPMNIHQIWDGQLIDSRKMSSSEYAQYLENKFEGQKEVFEKYSFFDSVKASYTIAGSIYSYDMSDTNTYHYIFHFMNDVDTMLFRGGIQLANILNGIYK